MFSDVLIRSSIVLKKATNKLIKLAIYTPLNIYSE